ncbi:hypothetical protein DFH08DRAFT_935181 [Mycena albidolilacea]|uniref:Hydrophobin n=1 Tax=Mycena albidolilacea TaxID=1033008 RepID=A0AAD7A7Z7_9AGAR|nr:hypothetical protein DFH08DRAFT_935181 [Mycena albidolilacea]
MFPKLSLAVTAVLATFAVASPTNSPPPPGTVNQCCNSVQASNSAAVAPVLSLLGIVLNAVVPVGLGCSPITIFGNNWSHRDPLRPCHRLIDEKNLARILGIFPVRVGLFRVQCREYNAFESALPGILRLSISTIRQLRNGRWDLTGYPAVDIETLASETVLPGKRTVKTNTGQCRAVPIHGARAPRLRGPASTLTVL